MNTKLVLLIVSLPPNPSSLRVRVWRRLRAIGAVALKRTVYLLPDSPDHYEHFQWLAQEIQRAGGEATILRVEQIENMSSEERSEEHTSELQSRLHLVCRLLLEKKKIRLRIVRMA